MNDIQRPPATVTLPDGTVLLALHDGVFRGAADLLHDNAGEVETAAIRGAFPDGFAVDVNCFALRRAQGIVLIDAGCGDALGPALGGAMRSLATAGIAPAEIADVLMTHLHGDHALGLFDAAGAIRFPDATIWCARRDLDRYGSAAARDDAPEARRQVFDLARRVIDAAGDRLRPFDEGEILPGIEAVSLPGHTEGHTGFLVGSLLLVSGDVFQVASLQGTRPSIGTAFDVDPAQAEQTRRDTLRLVAARSLLLAGAHLPFPGLVRVTATEGGYAFEPS